MNKIGDSTNVNLLHFGSLNLNDNDNKYIFYMVEKFIIDSKWFQGTYYVTSTLFLLNNIL